MRICHLINNFNGGGAQTFLFSLATAQTFNGNDVVIVILNAKGKSNFEIDLTKKLQESGVFVLYLDRRSGLNMSIFTAVFRFLEFFRSYEPDIINSHLNSAHLFVKSCSLFFGRSQQIITIHNAPEKWNRFNSILHRNTPTIYCSHAAEKFNRKRDNIVKVIQNGVSKPFSEINIDDLMHNVSLKKKIVLCVGRVTKQKNYTFISELAKSYVNSDVIFIICGEMVDNSLSKLELFDLEHVYYHPICTQAQIFSLMTRADCFLNASLHEGLPITVLEAFFLGVPCVLSNIPPNYEIGNEMPYTYVAKEFKVLEYVNAINSALSVELNKVEIMAKRELFLSKFEISNTASQYIKFYKNFISKPIDE